jgi:CheY-like chemotaxis protein
LARLRKLIRQALGAVNAPVAANPVPAVPPSPVLQNATRILVADDNLVNQKVAVRFLQSAGYTADVVSNGREAITALRRGDHSLVLMDVQMPEMDGLEATRRIREAQAAREPGFTRVIHIVAMTANAMSGDRELSLAAGMDDYLSKPLKPSSLKSVLDRLLGAKASDEPDSTRAKPVQAAVVKSAG